MIEFGTGILVGVVVGAIVGFFTCALIAGGGK